MVKKLLELNLNELNKSLNIDLVIKFKDNKFYIIENSKVIYEKDLSEVKLDFNSQKKLMLDILSKIINHINIIREFGYNIINNIIQIGGESCFDILGEGIAYRYKFVKMNIKSDYCAKLTETEIKLKNLVINSIRKNLDGNKVRVVYCEYCDCDGFYINKIIKENKLKIFFMENEINFNEINLYYTLSNDDDIEEAVKFITWKIASFYSEYLNFYKSNKDFYKSNKEKQNKITQLLNKIKNLI